MPHVVIECSANLDDLVEIDEVVRQLHDSALSTGVFPLGGIRTRVHVVEHYRIADGNLANAFAHVEIAIGQGRDLPTRRHAAETLFHALCAALDPTAAGHPLPLSLALCAPQRAPTFP